MKRAAITLALGAVVCGPTAGALATTGSKAPAPNPPTASTSGAGTTSGRSAPGTSTDQTSTPAPAAHSSATVLRLDDLLAVGETTADAGGSGSSATANAVGLGGKTLIDGKTGGEQKGNGTSAGSLLDTGKTPLGEIALTPWDASASSDNAGTRSASDAAIAHVFLIDPNTLDIYLLRSHSDANYRSSEAKSSSSSDGAVVDAGGGKLTVTALDSRTASGSTGSSDLASVNGNPVAASDQANGNCGVDASPVAKLGCLEASGGTGSTGQTASGAAVATADVGNGQLTGVVSGTNATGENAHVAPAAPKPTNKVKGQTHVRGETATNGAPNANQQNGALPFTGSNAALLSLYGAALTGLGAAILRVGRRRRPQTR